MADTRNRLLFRNKSLKTQAVWKLYTDGLAKKTPGVPLSAAQPSIAEIDVIWEYLVEEDHVTNLACSDALLELLSSGHAEFTYIYDGVLARVASAKNLSGIIHCLTELLSQQVLLAEKLGQPYICPFALRSPVHPFITVMQTRPADSRVLLQDATYYLCTHKNISVQQASPKILYPFLKYVFTEPQQSDVFLPMRNGLQRALCDITQDATQEVAAAITSVMISLLPCLQLKTKENITNAGLFLRDVCHCCLQAQPIAAHDIDREILTNHSLGLLSHMTRWNVPGVFRLTALVHEVCVMLQLYEVPVKCSVSLGIVILSDLLLKSSSDVLIPLLSIAATFLDDPNYVPAPPLIIVMLLPPLIQIISTPAPPGVRAGQEDRKIHELAARVVKMVERNAAKELDFQSQESHRVPKQQLTDDIYHQSYCLHLAMTFTWHPESVEPTLCALKASIIQINKPIPDCITNLAFSLVVVSTNETSQISGLELLTEIARNDPHQSARFLPMFQYLLSKEEKSSVRLAILKAIPTTATDKVSVGPVLRFIQSLGQSPRLNATSLNLLTALWEVQHHTYPYLFAAISNPKFNGWDVQIAKAQAVEKIFSHSAAAQQYGGELLVPLSAILNTNIDERDAPIVVLALRAIHKLCLEEVIDIQSTWRELSGKFTSEYRPRVICAMCDFLASVYQLVGQLPQCEEFVLTTVERLWGYTKHFDDSVGSTAFTALGHFPQQLFTLSHLPAEVTADFVRKAEQKLKQIGQEGATIEDYLPATVPGICYLRVGKLIDCYQGYSVFLRQMISKEVADLPRGISHNAMRSLPKSTNQEKILDNRGASLAGPPNYSYLPESSILRASVDLLIEAGFSGRERVSSGLVSAVLSSICMEEDSQRTLPPVNWGSVLRPLLFFTTSFGDDICLLCFKLAVSQCKSSSAAALLLYSSINPPLFGTLPVPCQDYLHRSLPSLIKCIPVTTLTVFVENLCVLVSASNTSIDSQCAGLDGLSDALRVSDISDDIRQLLYGCVTQIHNAGLKDMELSTLSLLTTCISQLPDNLLETITKTAESHDFLHHVYIQCHLMLMGRQPIDALNQIVDSSMNAPGGSLGDILGILCAYFYTSSLPHNQPKSMSVLTQVQWLLDFMVFVKKAISGNLELPVGQLQGTFAIGVVCAAITLWSSPLPGGLLGLTTDIFPSTNYNTASHKSSNHSTGLPQCDPSDIFQLLPTAMCHMEREPWCQILPQMIAWMISMSRLSEDVLTFQGQQSIKGALLLLRHTSEYRNIDCWTSIL